MKNIEALKWLLFQGIIYFSATKGYLSMETYNVPGKLNYVSLTTLIVAREHKLNSLFFK